MKLFVMEQELRKIKNRGQFPVPLITPEGIKIETLQDKKKVLDAVETEITEMIQAVTESEENYEREQEEARNRDQQLRLTRQTSRSTGQTSISSPWSTACQSETVTQEQISQPYTSTQTQDVTSIPRPYRSPMVIGTSHL